MFLNIFRQIRFDKIAAIYWGSAGAGFLFVCKEDDTVLLFLRSSQVQEGNTWGITGGALSENYTDSKEAEPTEEHSEQKLYEVAKKETEEEMGFMPNISGIISKTTYKDSSFSYTTFIAEVSKQEKDRINKNINLNWENTEFKWYPINTLPSRLHFGVKYTAKALREEQSIDLFPERIDGYDWIREAVFKIKRELPDEQRTIFDEFLEELLHIEDGINVSMWAERAKAMPGRLDQLFGKIKIKLKDAKNIQALREIFRIEIEAKKIFKNKSENLHTIPRSELAKYDKYLYHGTNLTDAYSIIKDKYFGKTRSYSKMSLTTSPEIAAKFGDIILAFDGRKMQRMGARKMKYIPTDIVIKELERGIDEDSKKNPRINEMYMYEREWMVPAPVEFNGDELSRIIIYDGDKGYAPEQYSTVDESIELLETITDVPIEIKNIPSYSRYSPTFSKKTTQTSGTLQTIYFKNVVTPGMDIKELIKKYVESLRVFYKKNRGPLTDSEVDSYYVRSDKLFMLFNDFFSNINNVIDNGNQDLVDRYQIKKLDDFYAYIDKVENYYEKYKNEITREDIELRKIKDSYLEQFKLLLDKIYEKKEQFRELATVSLLQKNNYYRILSIEQYGFPRFIKEKAYEWANNNFNEFWENRALLGGDPDGIYYQASRVNDSVSEVLKNIDPNTPPDAIWVEHPLSLIDNIYLERFDKSRIKNIFPIQGSRYDADWLYKYRLPYAKGESVAIITEIINIYKETLNPESKVNTDLYYHITYTENVPSILANGLLPAKPNEDTVGVYLFPTLSLAEDAASNWLGEKLDDNKEIALLSVQRSYVTDVVKGAAYEIIVTQAIPPEAIAIVNLNY